MSRASSVLRREQFEEKKMSRRVLRGERFEETGAETREAQQEIDAERRLQLMDNRRKQNGWSSYISRNNEATNLLMLYHEMT